MVFGGALCYHIDIIQGMKHFPKGGRMILVIILVILLAIIVQSCMIKFFVM